MAIQRDQRLGDVHKGISRKRGAQKARVAITKETLVIPWRILTYMAPYRTQNVELTQRKHESMKRVARTA